ncbi:CAP domain-containing protein [Pseudoblastomonas halimionae]|nr:CAP domain-containing protein [Alteriqipengyuania halimionae]
MIWLRLLAMFAIVSGLTAPLPAARGSADLVAPIMDLHNRERALFGQNQLAWSPSLAREAQDWADELARRGVLQHAGRTATRGAGENLWMGTAGYYSIEDMIGGFVEEKRHFQPGRFPDVSRTGDWIDVGHYTQMIWPTTQEIGCALATGAGQDVLVCRYWPAGNWMGHMVGFEPEGRARRTAP